MPTSVSLIVINYNGQRWIEKCLESIEAQSRPAQEVLVIDNCSSDSSPDQVRSDWPEMRLIPLAENVGFAAACNRGIEEAQGELVAILNNDIVLSENWLASLLEHEDERWDFWASKVVYASDPNRIDSAGDAMAVVGAAYKIGHGEQAEQHSQPREVFGSCAAAALYRKSMLEELGGFDDDFFLVYEDADLSMRARLAGYRCLFVPQATVLHHVNSSIGRLSHTYVYYGHRNSEYVFWQNMPTPLLLLYLPERLLFDMLSFFYFLYKGNGPSFLRAKFDFLCDLKKVAAKRRRIQQTRRLDTQEFKGMLARNWLTKRRNIEVSS